MDNRKKKLMLTTSASLVFQITTILTGLVLPRLILNTYGSEVNGLVNSIQQFLQIISFLELGVGAVVQSSLYKPLAENDYTQVSKILKSGNKFFRTLATVLIIYVICLIIFYPYLVTSSFDRQYTGLLIGSMCISSFAQYYFGVVDRLLITADQKGYIQYTAQTFTLIINTVACFILINCGASIQFVKLTTSLIYLLRPIFLRVYVNRHYSINRSITYEAEPIQQKWNGVAQHIAAVVLESTDNIVLTLFASLTDVSIYTVYHLVVYGIKNLFTAMKSGIHAFLGNLWAKQEIEELQIMFSWIEWLFHTGVVFVFGCTGILILPFVRVYTNGIIDADYIQPLFAAIIVLAHAFHCLRLPYNNMILAGGHFRQTQSSYIIAAVLNIVISIVMVKYCGLIGVAVGTLVAMSYQTIWMAYYDSKNFLDRPMWIFVKHIFVDFFTVVISTGLTVHFTLGSVSYIGWFVLAIKVASVWFIITIVVNCIFYRKMVQRLMECFYQRAKNLLSKTEI